MTDKDLLGIATEVRCRAYAPYSKFAVGAALLTGDGRVFTGCNVENISFGLTMCAERVALTSDSNEPVIPCGGCRQVLAEFAPDLRLSVLLPSARQGILG